MLGWRFSRNSSICELMKMPLVFGVLIGLLTGCHSTRVAVPLPAVVPVAATPRRPLALPIDSAGTSVTKPALPLPAPSPSAPPPVRASPLGPDKPAAYSPLPDPVSGQPGKSVAPQTDAPRQTGSVWGSILQVIGTGFLVGGIVAGLLVGGWAGFGLFLLGSVVGGFIAFCGSFLIDGQLP